MEEAISNNREFQLLLLEKDNNEERIFYINVFEKLLINYDFET
jgi:hypothetical protein